MFGYLLYCSDELVGLFAIATIEDVAFQFCGVSFELVDLWKRLAVLEVT